MLKKLTCALLCAVMLCGCASKSVDPGGASEPVSGISDNVTYEDNEEGAYPESSEQGEQPETAPAKESDNEPESSSAPEEIYEPTEESGGSNYVDSGGAYPESSEQGEQPKTAPAEESENEPESSSAPGEIYEPTEESGGNNEVWYTFRRQDLYDDHYKKHGAEFGSITQQEYLEKANALIASEGSPDVLTKYSDDGDYMYFNTVTEEFLVLSEDGYIRTYFIPTAGINYWNRQ